MAKRVLPKKFHPEFHRCVKEGDVTGLSTLLDENGIDANATLYRLEEGAAGIYLFLEAFSGPATLDMVRCFLDRGVDINLVGIGGCNALFQLFVRDRDLPVLAHLIDAGIDVNRPDEEGITYLYRLVRNYGDKTWHGDDGNEEPVPAERFALAREFIELLLRHGAEVDRKNAYGTSPRDWIVHRRETGETDETNRALEALIGRYAS